MWHRLCLMLIFGILRSDYVVALQDKTFDNFPGASSSIWPNPVCGSKIQINYNGNSVIATVVDRCAGCELYRRSFKFGCSSTRSHPSLTRHRYESNDLPGAGSVGRWIPDARPDMVMAGKGRISGASLTVAYFVARASTFHFRRVSVVNPLAARRSRS